MSERDREDSAQSQTGEAVEVTDGFVQTRLDWSVRCQLKSDGVVYEQARPFSKMATRVPYEAIPDDPVREMRISKPWAWASAAFFAAMLWTLQPLAVPGGQVDPMALLLSLIALVASAFMLRFQSGFFVVYPCEGKMLEFFDRDEDAELRAFIDHMQGTKARYLAETYGPRPSESSTGFAAFDDQPDDDPGGYRH